jgi:hypothetical protein
MSVLSATYPLLAKAMINQVVRNPDVTKIEACESEVLYRLNELTGNLNFEFWT